MYLCSADKKDATVRKIRTLQKSKNFNSEIMLTEQLTVEQQKELLQELFGFDLINVDESEGGEHWVVYDEEGNEFYGFDENLQFDFSTLAGFFSYTAHRAKKQGYSDCQFAMRKVLGI